MSRRLPPAEIIDAEFVVVRPRLRVSWWAVFWWCVYTAIFTELARRSYQAGDEAGVVFSVIVAALIVPGGRLVTWFLTNLGAKVTSEEADTLRRTLVGGLHPRTRR